MVGFCTDDDDELSSEDAEWSSSRSDVPNRSSTSDDRVCSESSGSVSSSESSGVVSFSESSGSWEGSSSILYSIIRDGLVQLYMSSTTYLMAEREDSECQNLTGQYQSLHLFVITFRLVSIPFSYM